MLKNMIMLKKMILLKKDVEENLVSWYTKIEKQDAGSYSLECDEWIKINGLCKFPHLWSGSDRYDQHGVHRYLLILDGAKDVKTSGIGSALFPQLLRGQFHDYRKVLEQFSKQNDVLIQTNPITNQELPNRISGVALEKSTGGALINSPHLLKVSFKDPTQPTSLFELSILE